MLRGLTAVLMLAALAFAASAQDDLPLTDYLRVVNAAFERVDDLSFDESILRFLVQKELMRRYGHNPDFTAVLFDVLSVAHQNVQSADEGFFAAYDLWRGLNLVWLKDASPPQDILTGRNAEIESEIALYDFEADGVPEILLRGDWIVEGYLGARWDGERWHEFHIPLPADIAANRPYYLTTSLIEAGFDDVNGDGLPEWRLLSVWSGGCQGCFLQVGRLHILGWRDGELVELVEPVRYVTGTNGVTWDFSETGFVKRQTYHDSWGCVWRSEHSYRWDGDASRYVFISDSLDYEDSFECAVRVAEKVNWAGELEAAAALYELALSRVPDDVTTIDAELYQYVRLRLALAYTLTEQHDQASTLVDQLSAETAESEFIAEILAAMRDNLPNMYQTCAAVHRLFTHNWAGSTPRANGNIPTEMTIGYVLDDVFPTYIYRPLPTPDKAGCNVEKLIEPVLSEGFFLYQTTPQAILEERGLDVAEQRFADMDGDGVEEWVVWLTANVPAIMIRPSDQGLATVERLELTLPATDAPVRLPTAMPTPDLTAYSSGVEYPCDAGASCDMRDAKTVWALVGELTGIFDRFVGMSAGEPHLLRAIESAVEQDSPAEYPLRYFYGLMLEEQGQIETARAEFAAILADAPDSAWAVLAALRSD